MHLKAGTEEDPTENGKVVALSLRGRKMGWASDTKAVMWSGVVPGLWKMSCRPTTVNQLQAIHTKPLEGAPPDTLALKSQYNLARTAISNSLENPTMQADGEGDCPWTLGA